MPLVLLLDAWQKAGHVFEDDQRHVEGVAGAHEAGGLLAGCYVDGAGQVARLIGDDPHGVPVEAAEPADDVRRVAGLSLQELFAVQDGAQQLVHVVRLLARLRHQRVKVVALPARDRRRARTRADPLGCCWAGRRGGSGAGR